MKQNKKADRFWAILNQEAIPVAVAWAKTEGGALRRFEESSKKKRDGYMAVPFSFVRGCCHFQWMS